jgi:hypothetical protein
MEQVELLQRRQAMEMDILIANNKSNRESRSSIASLVSQHCQEQDQLASTWKFKTEEFRKKQKEIFLSFLQDVVRARKVIRDDSCYTPKLESPTEYTMANNNSPEFPLTVGLRKIRIKLNIDKDMISTRKISPPSFLLPPSQKSAAIRFTSPESDRKFSSICAARNELIWPSYQDQMKKIPSASVSWYATRHSNLDSNIVLVFHVTSSSESKTISNSLKSIFTTCDDAGITKIHISFDSVTPDLIDVLFTSLWDAYGHTESEQEVCLDLYSLSKFELGLKHRIKSSVTSYN